MKPTDLRGILQYIPRFRDKTFVIGVDGAIVTDENFANLLLDIAVLRSLNIQVVLVHGAAWQIRVLAKERDLTPSDLDGSGPVDAATLELALTAANRLTHEVLEGLSANGLRGVSTNAVTAHPRGILEGVDFQQAGKVERIDTAHLQSLLEQGAIPVMPPLGFDGRGGTYRLNSDDLARLAAEELQATKLIYVTTQDGFFHDGELIRQIQNTDMERFLEEAPGGFQPEQLAKAANAVAACQSGIPRVHVINGQVHEGLLAEVFSNTGIGSLVYTNEYREIRSAQKGDVSAILALTRGAVDSAELVERSRADIEALLGDYHLYEIDGNPVACISLTVFLEEQVGEIGSLCVSTAHENQGIGGRLVQYATKLAQEQGLGKLFALSTQTFAWFQSRAGFQEGKLLDLPRSRREACEQSGRKSRIIVKQIP